MVRGVAKPQPHCESVGDPSPTGSYGAPQHRPDAEASFRCLGADFRVPSVPPRIRRPPCLRDEGCHVVVSALLLARTQVMRGPRTVSACRVSAVLLCFPRPVLPWELLVLHDFSTTAASGDAAVDRCSFAVASVSGGARVASELPAAAAWPGWRFRYAAGRVPQPVFPSLSGSRSRRVLARRGVSLLYRGLLYGGFCR